MNRESGGQKIPAVQLDSSWLNWGQITAAVVTASLKYTTISKLSKTFSSASAAHVCPSPLYSTWESFLTPFKRNSRVFNVRIPPQAASISAQNDCPKSRKRCFYTIDYYLWFKALVPRISNSSVVEHPSLYSEGRKFDSYSEHSDFFGVSPSHRRI